MAKKGGDQKRGSRSKKPRKEIVEDEYDDEIDAFHKQRDIVPLDVNEDTEESDSDDEQPVFELEGTDDEDEDDDEDEEGDEPESGLTAKMISQKKYLRAKFGDGDEEMDDGDDDKEKEEEEGKKNLTWGGRNGPYHGADNVHFDGQSSDDEDLKEEEQEALRIREEQAGKLTAADAGLDDDDDSEEDEEDSDRELTMGEIAVKGGKQQSRKETHVEEIKKDLNSLSKEEQMEVVTSSAPELVGLLAALKESTNELETKINPVLSKVKEEGIPLTGGLRYLEVKQIALLTYCQSVSFYLLLKSEGQPVLDHPVIGRLVEIRKILEKIKELDRHLPPGFEESLLSSIANGTVNEEDALMSPVTTLVAKSTQETDEVKVVETKKKGEKRKHKSDPVDMQSEEMLKLRASLEGKLRNNGVLGSTVTKSDKSSKRQKLANKKLETFDDYVDDADNSVTTTGKLSTLVSTKRKPKTVSGDDDLPQRDDIGERRRKFELRVLAGAGVKSEEDGGKNESEAFGSDDNMVDDNDGESEEAEDEFYKQTKKKNEAKRAAKAEIYSRKPYLEPSFPESESLDGKRLISKQMVSNRGLTRQRNKDLKNPRKKYRVKHEKKVQNRKGQVRDMRVSSGSYGGEATGINPNTSRSRRFKN